MASSLFLLAALSCLLAMAAAQDTATDIIRPCATRDVACLQDFVIASSTCTLPVVTSPPLDPYQLNNFYFNTPNFNSTENRTNVIIEGASQATFEDLFYNTTSKRAVLVLNFPSIYSEATSHIHYRITGTEGIDIVTDTSISLTNLTITTVFDDYNSMSLANSYSFPDIPIQPTFGKGEGLTEAAANDPRVARLKAAYAAQPMVSTMEAFKYRAPQLAKLYADYIICQNL